MESLRTNLFEVKLKRECHTILETPNQLPWANASHPTFNLMMIDVSASMQFYWSGVMTHWNTYIAPVLQIKETKLYVFGTDVYFRRFDSTLKQDDFLSQSTNLTKAIEVINSEIQKCKEEFVRLFLVTDGAHNASNISPKEEIAKLSIPSGKNVDVYLLGLGNHFPVEYSISIRSVLHNGNSNVPSLFWVQYESNEGIEDSIEQQIRSIADLVKKGSTKLTVSPPGMLAPGFPEINSAHLGEYLYFQSPPSEVSASLSLSVENNPLSLEISVSEISLRDLLDKVFCQWNSMIIQHHRKKINIPFTAFAVMENIYKKFHEKLEAELEQSSGGNKSSIKYRLAKKTLKYLEVEFATLMNQSKTIIGLQGEYGSELELAEKILKTTVKSKYDLKNLKMKGHGSENYAQDMEEFLKILEKIKPSILSLPEPSAEDCCRVTMGSMIKDLQDPSLPDLLQEDKFTFMKTFTVTGIPIYAPVKDSSQINPWTLQIKKFLNCPYTIVSQTVLELSADVGFSPMSDNKEVFLQGGDEKSSFNAVVPVFTSDVAHVLEPLIKSNIFAMLATFCILKNPHIIDHNAHIAALGCTWMKLITDYPLSKRPEFAAEKISLIESTARVYLGRSGIARYLNVLTTNPSQALMTESTETFDEKTLKCESLVKPMFLLYLWRDQNPNKDQLMSTIKLLITEYIGRGLLTHPKGSGKADCYSHFFVPDLITLEKRQEFLDKKLMRTVCDTLRSFISEKGKLIQTFYKVEDMKKSLRSFIRNKFTADKNPMFELGLNTESVKKLWNRAGAGDLVLQNLKEFAREMRLSEEDVEDLFGEQHLFPIVAHGILFKNSRDRMTQPATTYDQAVEKIHKAVESEIKTQFRFMAIVKMMKEAKMLWRIEYLRLHESSVASPMTRAEIIHQGAINGVNVTQDNFDRLYRYNKETGLLRNACMIMTCPFYLRPNRTFNQHIYEERKKPNFAHQLHKVSRETASKKGTADDVIQRLVAGKNESVNGLKVHPAPSAEKLNSVKDGIEQLIQDYRKLNTQ